MRQTGVIVEAIEHIDTDRTLQDYGHDADEVFDSTQGDVEPLEGEWTCIGQQTGCGHHWQAMPRATATKALQQQ